jgi:hypothetical protein
VRSVEPEDKATELAGTFIAALATVATGALVFSIGLVSAAPSFDVIARVALIVSWFAFGVSIIGGLLAQATIPIHVKQKLSIFSSAPFELPVRVQQIAFGIASLLLFLVLTRQLLSKPVAADLAVPSAAKALKIAQTCVDLARYDQVAKIELLPGDDATALDKGSWHLQFARTVAPVSVLDVFVNAGSAAVSSLRRVKIAKSCATPPALR